MDLKRFQYSLTAAIHLKTGEILYFKNRLVFPGSINAQGIKTIYYYISNVFIKVQIATLLHVQLVPPSPYHTHFSFYLILLFNSNDIISLYPW